MSFLLEITNSFPSCTILKVIGATWQGLTDNVHYLIFLFALRQQIGKLYLHKISLVAHTWQTSKRGYQIALPYTIVAVNRPAPNRFHLALKLLLWSTLTFLRERKTFCFVTANTYLNDFEHTRAFIIEWKQ